MSYSTIADLAENADLIRRTAACAAEQGVRGYPTTWVTQHMWHIAASPGWAAAFESALLNEVERPGNNSGVISDSMILSAVQKRMDDLAVDAEPPSNPDE